VCIIERATTPRERTLRSDLVNVVADASAAQVKAPAIIVVGGVVTALHDASAALMGNAVQDGDALMPEDMVAAVRQARAALALLESI
jgi:siroheme synthase